MKKLVLSFVILGAVAVAVVLGRGSTTRGAERLGEVEVVRVARRDIDSAVTATGVIKPSIGAEVRVGSRTSGVVRRLLVRVGDTVTRGQLLAELDGRELRARRAQAAAAVESSRASLDFAQAGAQRKLLSTVRHELRSPLTRMKVALALLPASEKRQRIAADVAEMEAMITELLELERLRDGRSIVTERQDLIPLLRSVAASFQGP